MDYNKGVTMNDPVIEIVIPLTLVTTNQYQTKELIEDLLPAVLTKVYTGDASGIEHIITARSVRVTGSTDFTIDKVTEDIVAGVSIYLEEELIKCGNSSKIKELLKTYKPIFSIILDTSGVLIRCQNKRISKSELW